MKKEKDIFNKFRDRKVLVVGLARSGVGAANLLSFLGAAVTVTDSKPADELERNINCLSPGIKVVAGESPERLFEEAELIVISPGVPAYISPLEHAHTRKTPVIGELELAYQTAASFGLMTADSKISGVYKPGPAAAIQIGVTGTNGKSTVTTLVDLMLKKSGRKTMLGGNIGHALSEEVLKAAIRQELMEEGFSLDADCIVAEISSFQLETIGEFRPRVGMILNISPDHLDRYENMDDYINAKARIFENQGPDDYLVLNADDPVLMKVRSEKLVTAGKGLPKIYMFSRKKEVEGVYCRGGIMYCNITELPLAPFPLPLVSVSDITIKGVHNLENAMAASLGALLSGCSVQNVKDALKEFPGLEHRLEYVGEIRGVTFINDSKGTNAGAVARSLESVDNVILIMGGADKGGDFGSLRGLVKEKVKLLIVLGEAKDRIRSELGDAVKIIEVRDLGEAVKTGFSGSSPGDVVMLSPGCASFDMFRDFEDRGRKFKGAVRGLRQ